MSERRYLVTGSSGLIGGDLVRRLRSSGYGIVTVDSWGDYDVHLNDLFRWLSVEHEDTEFVIHLGAITNTLETDSEVFKKYNYGYSESLWYRCNRYKIPFIYASSSATYGKGELGYSDSLSPYDLKPLNLYGHSKNEFDKFVLSHKHINDAPFWAGIKFFNVYGYDESHKGKMGSLIYQAYLSIKENKCFDLYDKERCRDFIYVEDVVECLCWLMNNRPESGIYNLGTGNPICFSDVASFVFKALQIPEAISYVDMPDKIQFSHQFYTQADISKLRSAGYDKDFLPVADGINKYIDILERK